MKFNSAKYTIVLAFLFALPAGGYAMPIVSGFDSNTLTGNDNGSTGLVNIVFDANSFGLTIDQLYVNSNGNVTLDSALGLARACLD